MKKKIVKIVSVVSCLMLISLTNMAQNATQTIRGIITDRSSDKPVSKVSVVVLGTNLNAVTDSGGRFVLNVIPLGRKRISFSALGYEGVVVPEVLVTSGKEVILEIALQEKITGLNEVVISGNRTKKGAAANEYAVGSSRSFNPDEVTRYAGGRNDASRLVSNFAGVVANSDSRNDIVVRGNSPTGVLWRIEGLPAPSPNHYATLGTTGGPVSALNTNALKTSDFLTGAFPAEFGNATAAVFDVSLRNGNASKHERTLQLNFFSGLEATLEGPLSKKRNGSSYLIGYRYSFVALGGSLGLNIGTSAVPKYQDWVYNINFGQTKAGRFSIYGMGGISNIDFVGNDIDTTDFYARKDQDGYSKNDFATFGAKHTLDLGSRSYIRTTFAYSTTNNNFNQFQYPLPFTGYNNRYEITNSADKTSALRFTSFVNSKASSQFTWRVGILGEANSLETKLLDKEGMTAADPFRTIRNYDGDYFLFQYYAQGKYRLTEQLTFNAGLHGTALDFNKTNALEPRVSASYSLSAKQQVYASYGRHSQIQPFPVYLVQSGTNAQSNKDLDFTKADHYVLGYENRFAADWRIKGELYYQRLFDVPVEGAASGFSTLNTGSDFGFPDKVDLVNAGTGSNQGIEITAERFLNKGYYFLLTGSFFDSKYKGSDGVERNTAFNYKNVVNVLAGREWKMGNKKLNAFTIDFRLSSIGGRYTTPVDLAASQAQNKEVLDENNYNSERLASYFRLDTKFGLRLNSSKRRMSQTIYFDLQNVTGNENIFLRRYNPEKRTIGAVNQIGFFPDLLYKITF